MGRGGRRTRPFCLTFCATSGRSQSGRLIEGWGQGEGKGRRRGRRRPRCRRNAGLASGGTDGTAAAVTYPQSPPASKRLQLEGWADDTIPSASIHTPVPPCGGNRAGGDHPLGTPTRAAVRPRRRWRHARPAARCPSLQRPGEGCWRIDHARGVARAAGATAAPVARPAPTAAPGIIGGHRHGPPLVACADGVTILLRSGEGGEGEDLGDGGYSGATRCAATRPNARTLPAGSCPAETACARHLPAGHPRR